MAKKKDENGQVKPKLKKGIFLSDVAVREIEDVLTHYTSIQQIELVEHLQQLFKEVADYFKTKDESIYRGYAQREQSLLKKYGKLFKPFADKRFANYFDFIHILSFKNYYTEQEYNALNGEGTELNEGDIYELTTSIRNFLDGKLHFLYLDQNPQFDTSENQEKQQEDKDGTEMQQLLAIHYLLKAGFTMEARGSNSVSQIAQLAHLLLGKKFTSLQNSSIYKKYKKLPNFDNPAQLIKDLKHILPYFEKIELQTVLNLINKDLAEATNENKRNRK